jgi:hypothetical protein
VTMVLPHDSSGAETHYRASVVRDYADEGKSEIANVKAITIDAGFLSISGTISFIKCDVERHELACIKGAAKFLAQSHAAWLIEVSGEPDDMDSAAYSAFKLLQNQDYFVWWYDGDKLIKYRPGDRNTNYFFLKENHIDILNKSELELLST